MKTKRVTNERVVKIGRVVAVNRPLDEQQRGRGALSALRRRRVTSQRNHLRMREHLFSYCPRPWRNDSKVRACNTLCNREGRRQRTEDISIFPNS